jgi:predicted nucleic acid-binding protein
MKALVLDSSTIISLALNNLLWILKPLKEKYNGEFYITEEIREEIIDFPITTKKFKLEAMQIQEIIDEKIIQIYPQHQIEKEETINKISNEIFFVKDSYMKIIDKGELSALVLAKEIDAEAIIIDERTTRLMIENPKLLTTIFKNKLHTKIKVNENNLKEFISEFKNMKVIRSTELSTIAYELGILDKYLSSRTTNRKDILEAVIWGMRFKGCAISDEEINEILQLE